MAGKLIVLEGVDGSGKSTMVTELAAHYRARGYEVVKTSEPDGWTRVGSAIHDVLRSVDMLPETELMLFFAARYEHNKHLRKWLDDGKLVLCDRYFYSSYAYQVWGRGADVLLYTSLMRDVCPVDPDLVLYLDVSYEESLRRRYARDGRSDDRLDEYDKMFYQRLCQAYESFIGSHGALCSDVARLYEFVAIDAQADIDDVMRACIDKIDAIL